MGMTYAEKARKCPVPKCDGEFIHEHTDKPNKGDYVNYMSCGHDLDDLCLAANNELEASETLADLLVEACGRTVEGKQAILKYGSHTAGCKCFSWTIVEVGPDWDEQCTCGFTALKKQIEEDLKDDNHHSVSAE